MSKEPFDKDGSQRRAIQVRMDIERDLSLFVGLNRNQLAEALARAIIGGAIRHVRTGYNLHLPETK